MAEITDCYPIELHYIKALFVQGQYRQCIQACRDVIKLAGGSLDGHPLQKAFVNLYLGLAHDEIARMMHHNSMAKMPAFSAAEQHYLDALESLPSPNQAAALIYLRKADLARRQEVQEDDHLSEPVLSPSIVARDSFDLLSPRSSSPVFFSPTPTRNSVMMQSLDCMSDFDDLESHDSFAELMTPKRVLQRDISRMSLLSDRQSSLKGLPRDLSRMSLLDTPPAAASNIGSHRLSYSTMDGNVTQPQTSDRPDSEVLPKAMSKGLMRQIRPGDAPGQYYVPPRLPYSGTHAHLRSKLPRLGGRSKTEPLLGSPPAGTTFSSPLTASPPSRKSRSPSPVSPLSKAESNFVISDASTVSPTSPRTPIRSSHFGSSVYMTANDGVADAAATLRLQEHLRAMADQIRTHIDHVQQSKQQVLQVQAEKRAARRMPTTGTPLAPIGTDREYASSPLQPSTPATKTGGLPKARSFWSFVPQDVKAAEKKKRIQDGRDRKWERKRFDPSKYQALCEKALEEL